MREKVFVITVENHDRNSTSKVSQETYRTLEMAQNYVKTRSNKPEKISEYKYLSQDYLYLITECTIVH